LDFGFWILDFDSLGGLFDLRELGEVERALLVAPPDLERPPSILVHVGGEGFGVFFAVAEGMVIYLMDA
jgi:hypothetical protein